MQPSWFSLAGPWATPSWFSPVGRWATLLLSSVLAKLQEMMRVWLLWVVSAGPIPSHIAFIMDGNRRFADRLHVDRHIGHSHGYDALLRTLKDCFDLHVKTVTLFAFSIDNFHRPPDEVSALMDLMQTKLEALVEKEGLASEYGIRVRILGDLSLLPHGARIAAEKAMVVTSMNNSAVLNLCISYTSTREIVQSIQRTCGNVVNALVRDDGSRDALDCGRVATCDCTTCDVPSRYGNGHAVWSHMACEIDHNQDNIDGSGELLINHTLNGDHNCSHGQHKEWHHGVGNGDSVCVNAYQSTHDGNGVYDQFDNGGCAHVINSCNGVVNMNDCKHICENGFSTTWDEGANNSEVTSKDVMAVESLRSSQVFACEVADSTGLRNRTSKKAGILENSVLQEGSDFVSMCDRDSNESPSTSRNGNNGCSKKDVKKAQVASRSGCSMATGACNCIIKGCEYVDSCACKANNDSSNSSSSSKLQSHSYQPRWNDVLADDAVRKNESTAKEGFLSNCTCGEHCYANDRIFKLVREGVSEEEIEKNLYTGSCPPPDLLIRTSGETRLSNFLLWQTSFSHLAFCKVLWPEFSFRHLFFIILDYQRAFPTLLRKRQSCNIVLFRK